ncbi:MAG: hypothetical protein RIC35_08675 [Marinoscillum sp.]
MKNLLVFVFSLLLLSCTDISSVDEMDIKLIENIPVSANTPNAFSYVIRANDFNQQINSPLNFDTASFVAAIVIGDYSSGLLSLTIHNEDSSKTYNQVITSNMVFSDFPTFHAASLELKLESFSGSVDLAVTVGD